MASLPGPERATSLRGRNTGDRVYRGALTLLALTLPAALIAILGGLLWNAWPSVRTFGLNFLVRSTWDPVAEVYGAAPMILGTLVSSLLALLIAVPLALGVAIFLTVPLAALLRPAAASRFKSA